VIVASSGRSITKGVSAGKFPVHPDTGRCVKNRRSRHSDSRILGEKARPSPADLYPVHVSVELDHIFVWTGAGAPEAERLASLGLTEGPPNAHPGQGTACRRFFFRNAYIELLWICDAEEAKSPRVRPLHLWERWSGRSGAACPFGFIYRPGGPQGCDPPFQAVEYRTPYLPPGMSIQVAANAGMLSEPMLFYLPFARRPDRYPADRRPAMEHATGLREIFSIGLTGPRLLDVSPELKASIEAGLLSWRRDADWGVELSFDGEKAKRQADLRPDLPLVLRW
jgi:hypothetical protein